MANETFSDILCMVENACREAFYTGLKTIDYEKVLECATQIYIAQMKGGSTDGEVRWGIKHSFCLKK